MRAANILAWGGGRYVLIIFCGMYKLIFRRCWMSGAGGERERERERDGEKEKEG